jgi:urease accessory protein
MRMMTAMRMTTTITVMIMRMSTGIGTIMVMPTTMGIAMATGMGDPPPLLRLLAWMSPSFPTGAFSYSHGLEMAVEDGAVRDPATLRAYVETALASGAGRCDGAFLALAWRAAVAGDMPTLCATAERAAAMRGSSELALESLSQGRAFLSTARAAWPCDGLGTTAAALEAAGIEVAHPVAVALVGAAWSVPLDDLLLGHLHAFAANLVSAGIRLVPLGQTDGQRVLAALEAPLRAAAARAAAIGGLDDVASAAPAIDLLSIRHETQYTRLFRS